MGALLMGVGALHVLFSSKIHPGTAPRPRAPPPAPALIGARGSYQTHPTSHRPARRHQIGRRRWSPAPAVPSQALSKDAADMAESPGDAPARFSAGPAEPAGGARRHRMERDPRRPRPQRRPAQRPAADSLALVASTSGRPAGVAPPPAGGQVKRFVRQQVPDSILQDAALNEALAVLPTNYNFELHKTVWRLRQAGVRTVALQFPEGLLMYACTIADILERFAGARAGASASCTHTPAARPGIAAAAACGGLQCSRVGGLASCLSVGGSYGGGRLHAAPATHSGAGGRGASVWQEHHPSRLQPPCPLVQAWITATSWGT